LRQLLVHRRGRKTSARAADHGLSVCANVTTLRAASIAPSKPCPAVGGKFGALAPIRRAGRVIAAINVRLLRNWAAAARRS